jgi:hypothetical protein
MVACVFSKSCISRIAYLPCPFFVRKTGVPTAASRSTMMQTASGWNCRYSKIHKNPENNIKNVIYNIKKYYL